LTVIRPFKLFAVIIPIYVKFDELEFLDFVVTVLGVIGVRITRGGKFLMFEKLNKGVKDLGVSRENRQLKVKIND
jgi:hypothetical protein